MAMRRRAFKRPFRRRAGGVRQITEPKRWQAANFNSVIQQEVTQDPFLGTTVMIELAKHQDHVGDMATGQGQSLSDIVTKFEIGGVVFDIDCYVVTEVGDADQVTLFHFTEFLCTIDLDSGGNPVVVPDFFQNQKPVAIANVNNIIANDTDFPTRIHWRSSYSLGFPTQSAFLDQQARNVRPRFTKSLRLKRYITDRQGLYLGVCGLQNLVDPSAAFFVRFSGTLYYRIRF